MKKIYFARHGESFDDVYNEFGSWNDRELTPRGVQTAFELTRKLQKLENKFDYVITSPLKRASQTAEIVGTELELRIVEDPYVKERNTYGLLSGVNKDLAVEEYPEMNAAYLEGHYIHGSERYGDFITRVKRFMSKMEKTNFENLICITQGYVITAIIEEYTDLVRNWINPGGIICMGFDGKKWKILLSKGVTFTDNPSVIQGLEIRKFLHT